MKKLSKLFFIILVLAMCFSFVGCFDSTDNSTSGNNNNIGGEQNSYTQIIVDDENCLFKITGVNPNGFYGYTLNVSLENKTNKNLMFSLDDVSVNDYMCDPFWAKSVTPGSKAVGHISFFESDFEELGITQVNKIKFTLNIYDEDDIYADYLIDKAYTIYPA